MKKWLLILCFVFLVTGCTTEVNLVIDEEKVSETIKISAPKSDVYLNDVLNEDIKSNMEAFEREYEFYDINEFEQDGYVGKTYELTEELELWSELSHLRPCYETFKFNKTETNISLETSEEYRCGYLFEANDVMLTIQSDLELISSNADKIIGNKLIWYINDYNYKNKGISFNYKINSFEKKLSILGFVIFLAIIILFACIFLFIKRRNKKNNKI